MRVSLDHIHIFSTNLSVTVGFFQRMFDATLVWDEDAAGARTVRLRLGNAFVQIYEQPPKAQRGGAMHHLGIETDDLDELVARMKTNGHEFRNAIREQPKFRYVMTAGPDDVLIELFQCHEPQRWQLNTGSEICEAPRAAIELDHVLVSARDQRVSARRLADLLGVRWAETGAGPFSPVYVNDGLTLDFIDDDGPFPIQHFCFRVDEEAFDSILQRIKEAGIKYRSTVRGAEDMQINTQYGGRMVYWNDPDGHQWEMLTVSYARRAM